MSTQTSAPNSLTINLAKQPWYKSWPKRLPHSIPIPQTSLWDNLAQSARRYPDKAAVHFFNRTYSYAELVKSAECIAAYLQTCGVKRGDRVVLCMQNCPQLIIAHFAILRLGAVVVPVNPMNRAEELKHYITDPDARVAFTTADLADELAKANNALDSNVQLQHMITTHLSDGCDWSGVHVCKPPVAWGAWLSTRHAAPTLASGQVHDWDEALKADPSNLPADTTKPEDLSVLPYTSGTTGLPKGCEHTHSSIMHNAAAGVVWGNSSASAVMLLAVPMFHITGMVSIMHSTIFGGATLVVMPRWDRDLAGELISHYKVTHWANIPTMVMDLLASPRFAEYDLSSLKYIGGGGAAMPQAVAQRLFDAYGLRYEEGYGLTETAAPSHSNPHTHPRQQCLGIPYMSTDSRIVNAQTLEEVPIGEEGEIVMCGPQNFKGYWKRPDATAAAFFELDGKRFFRSGDIGRMDEDGFFYITDRLKRMINASGFKVWPAEVEALMFKHEAIAEACVIASKDSYRGETVKACVVLRASHLGKVTEADIVEWCRTNMAVYKAPKVVQFMSALPKSGSGKTMWRHLQEQELAKA